MTDDAALLRQRFLWNPDHDDVLKRAVKGEECFDHNDVIELMNDTSWTEVAAEVSLKINTTLTRKQVNERYKFHLAPFINNAQWTQEEVDLAMALDGKNLRIHSITKLMPSAADGSRRTSLNVSNMVHTIKRRRRRADEDEGSHTPPVRRTRQRIQPSQASDQAPDQAPDQASVDAEDKAEAQEFVSGAGAGAGAGTGAGTGAGAGAGAGVVELNEFDEDESSNFALGNDFPLLNMQDAFTWADHIEPSFWPCLPI
jgi:hypothetical protein